MKTDIIIAGVGGQGTLLASKLIGAAALLSGYDVKVSESHGMSQRGGSVTTYVRYSDKKVYSPVVTSGADIILSFELLEGYRMTPLMKKDGRLVTSVQTIDPIPVIAGEAKYPERLRERFDEEGIDAVCVDAFTLALEAGSQKCANVVLIGALAARLNDIKKDVWLSALVETIPQRLLAINQKAFELGYAS